MLKSLIAVAGVALLLAACELHSTAGRCARAVTARRRSVLYGLLRLGPFGSF